MTQDEILAAKAAALATAKSELETATGFRAPLAPGSRPPQLRRTESTGPSSLLAGPAQTPAPGSTPAGQGTWPSPAAPTDGPVAADFYPGGQPTYTQSRPPVAIPADTFAPQPTGTSTHPAGVSGTHPAGVSGEQVPPVAGNTPFFTAPGFPGSATAPPTGVPPFHGYSGTQPQQQPPPPRTVPTGQSQSFEASLYMQSLSTSPATDVAGDGSVLTNRPHPLQLQALRTGHQALQATPAFGQDWLGQDFAHNSRARREELDKQSAKASLNIKESEYRGHYTFPACEDNGRNICHPIRWEPLPHMTARSLFAHGCKYLRDGRYHGGLVHDLSHIRGGSNIDPRAFIVAGVPSHKNINLQWWLPSTFGQPTDKLESMRDVLRAWNCWKGTSIRMRPWDFSWELCDDFLARHEMFASTQKAYEGYFRLTTATQASAVLEFILASLREFATRHNASQVMCTDEDMANIHKDLCENSPRSWSAHYPSRPADGQRAPRTERTAKGKPTATAKQITKKQQIRAACDQADTKLCTRFNLGEQCTRPFDPATDSCSHTSRSGVVSTLSHTCAHRTAAGRCAQKHAAATH